MRTVVAGSRGITDYGMVRHILDESPWYIAQVVSGGAQGVDRLAEGWAKDKGLPVERFPADWEQFGKSAGVRRNVEMAKSSHALIAIWDGESRGTRHMIDAALDRGLRIYVQVIR